MMDLNSTLFFKGKLSICSKTKDNDLLWNLVLKIRDWMFYKWKKNGEAIPYETSQWTSWKFGSNFSSKNEIVHFKSVYHKENDTIIFWACKIIESCASKDGHAPREWTTEIGFEQQSESSATISIVIYYSDRPGFIGPCEPTPTSSIPNILRKFIEDLSIECTIDGHPFNLKPIRLIPEDFSSFWEIVCDENREIPVIYISPRTDVEKGTTGINLIDPQKLIDLLGPNALIYYADDISFSREMTRLCTPQSFGCYSGGIRIYAPFPRINDSTDSYRHRYITAQNIIDYKDSIYDILRRALAQDVHFYEKMFRVEDCKLLNDRTAAEKRKQKYKETLENDFLNSAVESEKKLLKQLHQVQIERDQLLLDQVHYETQIKELKNELHQSQNREDAYREAAVLSNRRKEALDSVRNIPNYPKTPKEIASFFEEHFVDRIAFTEKGKNSLRTCTTEPGVLWDALYQISTRLYDLFNNDDITSIEKEFNHCSNLYFARGEGAMTRRNSELMRQYTDTYQGKTINIEAHIKTKESKESSSKFLRIYLYYDNELHKIIIGSCGRHLNNYTSLKIK